MLEKIYCLECRTELTTKAKFCPECGKPAPKPEPIQPKAQEQKQFPPIMNIEQVAEFLCISKCHVYRLIKNEGLPYFPVSQHKRFIADEIMQWAKSRQIMNK
ncbi:helix-turn-helix domain-containing protein [Sporomusa sphaeroides]|uniref:Helix-turn-helix domain protein n=1 Tax=Sporomusa sphaeroides DSM 2875 TaxID=1337886 RepID=A0ABP2C2K0_9FIRM|nr:helix-turn-helix domain-containing protein [Sporomusa sphaeroides]OLS58274.1 helix-turn-helix domain protein [Sporomusa sphaeroides DSM 2875]CVK17539.1 Helix-turn-helix domain protein [Sporomusa sphaeroides DSM 2875]